jgi:predicted  nucleic acid-binding Zn-ribbon protein
MLELEKHLRALKNDNLAIESLRVEIENYQAKEKSLKLEISGLNQELDKIKEEKLLAEQQHIATVDALNKAHDANIKDLYSRHEAETAQLKNKYNLDINALKNHISENDIKHKEELGKAADELSKANSKISELEKNYEELKEQKRLTEAMLKGLRADKKLMTDEDEFTSKDSFDELEREYEAFTRFFKSQWKKSKKKIRKEMLTVKNFKNKDENDGES